MLILKQIPLLTPLAENSTMEIVIYHCLVLGFAAMALKMAKEKEGLHCQGSKIRRNHGRRLSDTGPHWACHLDSIFLGRKLVLCRVAYSPMGFGQNTGSALSLGSSLETNYVLTGGADLPAPTA